MFTMPSMSVSYFDEGFCTTSIFAMSSIAIVLISKPSRIIPLTSTNVDFPMMETLLVTLFTCNSGTCPSRSMEVTEFAIAIESGTNTDLSEFMI